jgi:uncharacterized protein (TIGR03083 family)
MDVVAPLGPIFTAHLFPQLDRCLVDLLRSLTPADWSRPTLAPRWTVKDVAAHLLDTQVRRLSFCRDGYVPAPAPSITSDRDLVAVIDRMNADGVAVYGRLSPDILIGWIERASVEAASYLASLDPFAPAVFSVSWAGDAVSPNWFDVARELTERWHHQQQIRLAVHEAAANGARSLRAIMTPELYHPVLDCFMRALPHHYRTRSAEPGTGVTVEVTGDCGGAWHLYRADAAWLLTARPTGAVAATVAIPQDIAWRLFTKGIPREQARERVTIAGDALLGSHVLEMLAIVG